MSNYVQLADLIDSVSKTHKFDQNKLIFLNTSDVSEGKILVNHYSDVSTLKGQAKKTIKNGDILYSEIRPKNRRYAYVKNLERPEDYVVSTKLMVLRKKSDKICNDYLYHFLTYDATLNYLQRKAENRIGSFPQITFDVLKVIKIWLPDLVIQQKIAAVLSALDDKIELNNQINTELEAMAKTLYDYWFVQFDFPDENGKPYQSSGGKMVFNDILKREIPVGWEVKSFDGLIDFTRGVSYTSATMNESVGIPMINLKSFNLNGTYRIDGLKYFTGKLNENRIISKSDLLIAITDVTRDAEIIGKAILVPEFSENAVCSCDVSRVDILNESFSKNYLRYLFNSSYYHNYIKHYASGTLVLHLDLKGILWYTDVIPPKELQLKFDHFVNKIDAKIQTNLQQNKELAQLRDWLLPMLMNGQVRVGSGEYEMEEGGLGMVGEGKREYKKI